MLELPEIPKDRSKKYEYKGQEISVNQMAKYTGWRAATIRKKLNEGVAIEDIINLKQNLKLTVSQKMKRDKNGLTTKIVQKRLDDGWDLDLALELRPFYVGTVDNIVYKTTAGGIDIEIPYKKLLELEKVGVTARTVCIRVGRGSTLEEAMNENVVREDSIDLNQLDEMNEDIAREGLRRYKIEKARKSKPHLETVPQKHKLSDYGRYLMSKPGIARVKTDLYGNTQFI